jgi:hypothetical protein
VAYFKVSPHHLTGWTKGTHEKPTPGYLASEPRYEPETFRIRSKSVRHSTKTLRDPHYSSWYSIMKSNHEQICNEKSEFIFNGHSGPQTGSLLNNPMKIYRTATGGYKAK